MADETIDRKAAEAEAKADAKVVDDQNKDAEKVVEKRRKDRAADENETGPVFANTVQVTEKDFPKVADANLLSGAGVDANEGWTAQSELPYVNVESIPGQYVQPHELPTLEGLRAHDIDPVSYVAGVPVRK